MNRLRYILLATVAVFFVAATAQDITGQEYWLDGDVGNKQSLESSQATIDISSLAKGLHSITMRVKKEIVVNEQNVSLWSSPVTKYFLIPRAQVDASSISSCEYWFDGDIGNRMELGSSVAMLNVATLSKGIHTISMQAKDDKGKLSSTVTKYFIIPKEETTASAVRYMYWFDDDLDNKVVVETTDKLFTVEVGGLSEGKHTIYWRVGDSNGTWSQQVNNRLFNYVLPPTGVGALSSDIQLALHDDLQAGYCTEYDAANERIQVEELTTIPANTGVLLRGKGYEKVTLLETEGEENTDDNQLIASVGKTLLTSSEAIDTEGKFLIGSVDDWKEFATQVSTKPDLNAVMTADVDLGDEQTKIGTSSKPYKGVFDGQGHTLTVHLTGGNDIAPFVSISNAKIKNLHVDGTITVTGMRGSGIASYVAGNSTIENCRSSVIITTSAGADFDGGGFIGRVNGGYTVSFTNCLFDGQILKTSNADAFSCGGFVGWTQSGASATLENCFFNPSAPITINEYSSDRTFVSGYSGGTITNCYFTLMFVEAQGTDASVMSKTSVATALGSGWTIQDNHVVPIMVADEGDYINFYLNNSLFLKVESMVIIPANKAYLRLPSSVVGETKVVKLWWGNEEPSPIATSISEATQEKVQSDDWFTIEGIKLNGKPTEKGIYIRNGKKIIIK